MTRLARRRLLHRGAVALCFALAIVAAFPLVSVLWELVRRGAGLLTWDFLSHPATAPLLPGGGIQHAIQGTVLVVALGTALGAPFGLLVGTYLAESSRRRAAVVRTVVDAMAGMPSIVAGLFAYAFVVVALDKGYSAWAAATALAVLMTPTVTRTTEEALRTVPQSYRDASLALGSPRWRTTLFVVFPAAWGPVLTGLLLGVARVAGETAPLVVTMIYTGFAATDPNHSVATLPQLIYSYGKSASPKENAQAWGAALVLILMVLLLNLVVRGLTALRARRLKH